MYSISFEILSVISVILFSLLSNILKIKLYFINFLGENMFLGLLQLWSSVFCGAND